MSSNRLELVVGIDLRADFFVLQIVLLDVFPELLGELSAGKGFRTNDHRKDGIGLDGFEECSVGFASGFFCHSGFWN